MTNKSAKRVGAAALAAALVLLVGRSGWTERLVGRHAIPGPKYPVSAAETAFTADIRAADRRVAPQMATTPFTLSSALTAPDVRAIVLENGGVRPIQNVWFYRADMPNFYSAQTILQSATVGKTTETEKALALWALFPRYYYNYYPLQHAGPLVDPPTLLGALGSAQCNYASAVLQTLCQMAGMETRTIGISYVGETPSIEHCCMEVKADGKWIFMDPDGHAVYRRADGGWASVEDLKRDATPVYLGGHAYYPRAVFARAFAKGKIHAIPAEPTPFSLAERQTLPARYSGFHHYLRFDLLPGASMTLFPRRRAEYYEQELPVYTTGELEWSLKPEFFAPGADSGLLLQNATAHVRGDTVEFRRVDARREASVIVSQTNPYLVTGGMLTGDIQSKKPVRAWVLPYVRVKLVEEEWKLLGNIAGKSYAEFGPAFGPQAKYGYALKIEVPAGGCTVRALRVMTHVQCSFRALPTLAQGENRFFLYSEQPFQPAPSSGASEAIDFDGGLRIRFDVAPRSDLRSAQ